MWLQHWFCLFAPRKIIAYSNSDLFIMTIGHLDTQYAVKATNNWDYTLKTNAKDLTEMEIRK